jgi:hypothetical protein
MVAPYNEDGRLLLDYIKQYTDTAIRRLDKKIAKARRGELL